MTFIHYILALILACFAVVLGALIYITIALFWPVQTIVFKNFSSTDPIYIETPVVHAGDVIKYYLDYCKYTEVVPKGRAHLIDGQSIPLTSEGATAAGLPLGCHKTEREVTIPETVNPGRYYYDKVLDYPINPFRTEHIHYYTQYFQVVGPEIPSTSKPPTNKNQSEAFPTANSITYSYPD